MLKLSADQMRRIEQEERVKLAEEQYRSKVREQLVAEPAEPHRPARSNSLRNLLLLILFAVIAYAVLHANSG